MTPSRRCRCRSAHRRWLPAAPPACAVERKVHQALIDPECCLLMVATISYSNAIDG